MDFDAQLAGTQIGKGKCPGNCPGRMFGERDSGEAGQIVWKKYPRLKCPRCNVRGGMSGVDNVRGR